MVSTKVTARPNPIEVLTVLDTARYEHIPKKYANIILSIKIDFIKRFKLSIFYIQMFEGMYYFSWSSVLCERCTQMIQATTIRAIGGKIISPLLAYPIS